jgi:hypothetical protein
MAERRDLNNPDPAGHPSTTVRHDRRRTSWSWGILTLVAVLAVIGVVAWTWDYDEPVATGTVAPPAGSPATPAQPLAPPPQ